MYLEEDLTLKRYVMNNLLHIKNMNFDVYQGKIDLVSALLNVQFHFPLCHNTQSGIYKIIFNDDTWYIGKSKNIIKRIWEHLCETLKLDVKKISNEAMYQKIFLHLKNKDKIIVLKLSENTEDEYKMLNLHLSIDENHCYNTTKNHRLCIN
jgi:hypothetical protein